MFNLNYYKSFLKLAVCRLDPLINFSSLRKMDVNYLNFKSEHIFSLLKVFQRLHTSYKIEFQLLNFVQSTYNLVCLYASCTSHYTSLLKVLSVGERKKEKVLLCLSGDSDISPLVHGFSSRITARTDDYYYQNQIQTRITHRPISKTIMAVDMLWILNLTPSQINESNQK